MIMERLLARMLAIMALGIAVFAMATMAAESRLDKGFTEPPMQLRTRCWWNWLNGNVTKKAINKDLEWMKKIGMGGGAILDLGLTAREIPAGPVFNSAAWRKLFKHAVHEADRLGLELSLNPMSGWTLGGPSVTPEQALKRITWSEKKIQGPVKFAETLPLPPSSESFYRDARVAGARFLSRKEKANKFQKYFNIYACFFQLTRVSYQTCDKTVG